MRLPRILRRRRSSLPGTAASTLLGAGLAAGLALAFDPASGRRRRAFVQDKLTHAGKHIARVLPATGRDLQHRARGFAAMTRRLFQSRGVPDEVLVERVRARLGRFTSRPHAIEVLAQAGRVTLTGIVYRSEAQRLIRAVRRVNGVSFLDSRLRTREGAWAESAFHGATGHARLPAAGRLLAGAAIAAGAAWLVRRSH